MEWVGFEELFGEVVVSVARELQRVAGLGGFRAAVAWQNRPVLGSGVGPFLAWVPSVGGRSSMPRQREELVAHYWQRFCVKNDTIGFFGPVGWGRWDLSSCGVSVDPGVGFVAASEVYFASWAIDAVAKLVNADPALRPWIAPRRIPFVRVADGAVTLPGRPPQRISPGLLEVLARCDGVRPARDVGPAEALEELVRRRIVVWRLEVPADARPERWMRRWLESAGAPGGRALELLDALESGRGRVADATDPDELVSALTEIESTFVALTDEAAVREKGANTAPCRALVYSDSRRSAEVRLGKDVLESLAPLELLLTAARWLTWTLAQRVMARVEEVYQGPVDLATFWFACAPILHGDAAGIAADVQAEFWRRWESILPPLTGSQVHVSMLDIAGRVRAEFAAPGAGWTAARYSSPDVLMTGSGDLVLGELHVATNTLGASLFVNQHESPASLLAETSRDHPGPRLMPLLAKEHRSRLSARIRHALVRPEDYYVALVDYTADPARPRTVLSADATVESRAGRLVAVLPDGAEFPVVDVFSHVLTTLVMDMFRLPDQGGHSPRVTVDRMVISRESWRFAVDSLSFADEKNEARRFVKARWWQREAGLPRFVFVVSPTEPRPFYVDFDSPVYVNILAKSIRRLSRKDPEGRLTVTEMLPTPDQAWLTDANGHQYTSELRFVAVDE
ncbi:Lantibiotic dehydratase [Kibdelosporangium sp. 4NS15]|uniref:Lantibiotic dehydratase n=1 Tax=Kibdelosporangium persicum TaxID=2698649 RepID=A0ABX2FG74_9PSEU|nr:Lantibiotic dehydratase [Kibdelosporangium persicum]